MQQNVYALKEFGVETIFAQKLLVNFTNNYNEMARNLHSCKTYSSSLCFIYNFEKYFYSVERVK